MGGCAEVCFLTGFSLLSKAARLTVCFQQTLLVITGTAGQRLDCVSEEGEKEDQKAVQTDACLSLEHLLSK